MDLEKYTTDLRFCESILAELRKPKYQSFVSAFATPVDHIALNIPQYPQIIKRPMDLQTISEKLNRGEYRKASEFENDFRLMLSNCYKFNPEGNMVYTWGRKLEALFDNEWSKKDASISEHRAEGRAVRVTRMAKSKEAVAQTNERAPVRPSNPKYSSRMSPEQFGDELVTIYAGPKRKKLTVHKSLLYQGIEMDAAFTSNDPGNHENVVFLPELSQATVSYYITWLYQSAIPVVNSWVQLEGLFSLYTLAENFNNVVLVDNIMDAIQDTCRQHGIAFDIQNLGKIYSATNYNSPLQCFGFHLCFYNLSIDHTEVSGGIFRLVIPREKLTGFWEYAKADYALFEDLCRELMMSSRRKNDDPLWWEPDPRERDDDNESDRCHFHSHAQGKCHRMLKTAQKAWIGAEGNSDSE